MCEFLAEDQLIGLMPYSEDDASDFVACWRDEATQRGYNFILPEDAQGSVFGEIAAYPFWVVAVEKSTGKQLGVLRLSPDADAPDLAIWVYPAQRGSGWGKRMYQLALQHLFARGYEKIYAGCFPFNAPSLRILERCGFIRWPDGDMQETSVFDGNEITMLGYVCIKQ